MLSKRRIKKDYFLFLVVCAIECSRWWHLNALSLHTAQIIMSNNEDEELFWRLVLDAASTGTDDREELNKRVWVEML